MSSVRAVCWDTMILAIGNRKTGLSFMAHEFIDKTHCFPPNMSPWLIGNGLCLPNKVDMCVYGRLLSKSDVGPSYEQQTVSLPQTP